MTDPVHFEVGFELRLERARSGVRLSRLWSRVLGAVQVKVDADRPNGCLFRLAPKFVVLLTTAPCCVGLRLHACEGKRFAWGHVHLLSGWVRKKAVVGCNGRYVNLNGKKQKGKRSSVVRRQIGKRSFSHKGIVCCEWYRPCAGLLDLTSIGSDSYQPSPTAYTATWPKFEPGSTARQGQGRMLVVQQQPLHKTLNRAVSAMRVTRKAEKSREPARRNMA